MSQTDKTLTAPQMNPLTLSFSKESEDEFLKYYFSKYLPHMRFSIILGMVIWGVFGIVDLWVAPARVIDQLLFIRYSIVWPIMIGCYFFTYKKHPEKHMNLVITIGILAAAFAIIAKMATTPLSMNPFWNTSLIVIFIYGYAIMRPRYVWATLTGAMILITYQIVAIWFKIMPNQILIKNTFILFMGNLLGMYICYTLECFARKDFLSAKRIEQESQKTHRANQKLHGEIRERLKVERELQKHKDDLEKLVMERTKQLDDTQHEIVFMLSMASEYRDEETGTHIKRMSKAAALVGQELGLNENTCHLLFYASQMHDIGKIGIPDAILLKPDALSPEEWRIMKRHTTIGAEILSGNNSDLLQMAQTVALSHHERWDGSGYPKGLSGENIPLYGRITIICDVFDALIHDRPYKRAWPLYEAIEEIDRCNGTFFDPIVYKAFKKILPQLMA
jgi:HD-GYP domain-containing protein (c-di-GMP phosphodiesterase class II)